MTLNLPEILLERWKRKTLASFYLLTAPPLIEDPKTFLKDWTDCLIISFLQTLYPTSTVKNLKNKLQLGHPDLLMLSTENGRNYRLEDFKDFFTITTLAPYEWPHRFVIIEEIHLISELICNKLLKILENLPSDITIFFLHSVPQKLLPTIESRAIHLQITLMKKSHEEKKEEEKIFITPSEKLIWWQNRLSHDCEYPENIKQSLLLWIEKQEQFHLLLDFFKDHPEHEKTLCHMIIDSERSTLSSYEQKLNLIQTLQSSEKSSLYHNSAKERIAQLLEYTRI